MEAVLQRPVPTEVSSKEGAGKAAGESAAKAGLPQLRKGVPTGMGPREAAAVLQRCLPDQVVGGVSEGKPGRRSTSGGMRFLRGTAGRKRIW